MGQQPGQNVFKNVHSQPEKSKQPGRKQANQEQKQAVTEDDDTDVIRG